MKQRKINWTRVPLIITGFILAICCPSLMLAICAVWFIWKLFSMTKIETSTPKDGDSK